MVGELEALGLLREGQDVQQLLSPNHVRLNGAMDDVAFRESLIPCKDDVALNVADLAIKDLCPAGCEWTAELVGQAKARITGLMTPNYEKGHAMYHIPLRVLADEGVGNGRMDGEISEALFKHTETFRSGLRVCPQRVRNLVYDVRCYMCLWRSVSSYHIAAYTSVYLKVVHLQYSTSAPPFYTLYTCVP